MLQLVQQVTGELGLVVPTFVAGNTSQDAQQILSLMNAVGTEMVPKFDWQQLDKEYRFYTQFIEATGDTVTGSPVITNLSSTAGVQANTWMVTGGGVPQDSYVVSVDSPNQITISQPVQETAAGVVLSISQTKYPMPTDYDRQVNRTQWDKSKHWEMLGPESPQQWQWLKSGYIATGPRIRWRIMGNFFQIWPALNTQEYLGFEYISKAWVYDAAGNAKTSLTADTDTSIFSDRMMVIGTKLKYFEVKNFDTTALWQDFNTEVELRKALEQGAPMLSFSPRLSQVLIDQNAIPDSGYGQVSN
jgi:hypothetical protein